MKANQSFINAVFSNQPLQSCLYGTLTAAGGLWWRRGFLESCVLLCGSDGWIRLQALGHLVTDDIHEALKCLLDINVILGTCFEKFKSWKKRTETQSDHFLCVLKLNGTWSWEAGSDWWMWFR